MGVSYHSYTRSDYCLNRSDREYDQVLGENPEFEVLRFSLIIPAEWTNCYIKGAFFLHCTCAVWEVKEPLSCQRCSEWGIYPILGVVE